MDFFAGTLFFIYYMMYYGFAFVSGPELTLSYISLVAAAPVIDYNTNSAPQHFFLLFLSVIVN